MARKKTNDAAFVAFDVVYENGTRSSNRRVPSSELGSFDGDAPARTIIEAQDQKIAALSGQPPRAIKSISRSPL
jgi:hypothetical protein